MKRYILSIIAIMIVLSACKKDAVNKSVNDGKTTPVTFRLGFAQSTGSFNGAANVTNSTFGERNKSRFSPHTLAADTALTKYASVILVGLYASDGTKISLTKQLSSDTTFGKIGFNLSPGNYIVTFVAGQSGIDQQGTNVNTSALLYDTTINNNPAHTWKNTFYKKINLTVGSQGSTQTVTLDRIGSEIIVDIEDAVPSNVKFIAFVAGAGDQTSEFPQFNVGTGATWPGGGVSYLFASTSVDTAITPGKTNTILCVPALGTDNLQFPITIFAYDQLPTVNRSERRITQYNGNLISNYISTISVQSGHQTILTGKLFGGNGLTNTGGFRMTIDPQWSPTTTTIPFQ